MTGLWVKCIGRSISTSKGIPLTSTWSHVPLHIVNLHRIFGIPLPYILYSFNDDSFF